MQRRRVLIANEPHERLDRLAEAVAELGHEAIGCWVDVDGIRALIARERPEVALVGPGPTTERALNVITALVHAGACPVIALLETSDPGYLRQAARRGIFAYLASDDATQLQATIDIALQRFAEYHALEGAFGRRAVTERAKGILMERHSLDEQQAFHMLREQARRTNRKIVDVAEALLSSHRLLPMDARPSDANDEMLERTDEDA